MRLQRDLETVAAAEMNAAFARPFDA